MLDRATTQLIKRTVRDYCSPDMIHATLANFQDQAEEAEGKKKILCEAFVEGIRLSLGKVS